MAVEEASQTIKGMHRAAIQITPRSGDESVSPSLHGQGHTTRAVYLEDGSLSHTGELRVGAGVGS
jgi:hypothetical protein